MSRFDLLGDARVDEVILLIAIAAMLLAIPICLVILLVGQSRLKRRVGQLELQLAGLPAPRDAALTTAEAQPLTVEGATDSRRTAPEAAVVDEATEPRQSQSPQSEVSLPDPAPSEETPATLKGADRFAGRRTNSTTELPDQNRPLVLRTERISALFRWLTGNWVYAVSALSLAMAGVFLVQYGVEHGLLPPTARVLAAIALGAGLIGVGQRLRRGGGDEVAATTAYLPSVFSGAGLVAIFAGIIAARQLYGLIGPEFAFLGLLATAALAVGLGWFYGPLLAAVGLLGAAATPFLVAGDTAPGLWLFGYYGLIAAVGLAVDAVRRWAWVSVLALVLGYGGGYLMLIAGAGVPGWTGLLLALALMAAALPLFRLIPDHPGPTVLQALALRGSGGWPSFPVRLAAGAGLASALGLWLVAAGSPLEGMLVYAGLTLLALAYLLWADRAPGLADLGLLPAAAFLARLTTEALNPWPVATAFWSEEIALRQPESAAPLTVTYLLGMATLISAAAAIRALRGDGFRLAFGLGAVLVAPLAAAVLELLWAPAAVVGSYPWALQIVGLAALMVALALQFARADGPDRRRVAHATLSALSLIALALFVLTTQSALTLALAVLAVVAAWLDRRLRLPEMAIFIQIGVAVLGYRLLVDPGIVWAMTAGLGAVIGTFAGVIAALVAALVLLRPLDRQLPVGVLESAVAGFAAVLGNIVITRWLLPQDGSVPLDAHYAVTLNALPWLVMLLMQLYRARLGGALRRLRLAIGALAGLFAAAGLAVAVGPSNPLFTYYAEQPGGLVRGPLLLDSLFLAYVVPGGLLLAAGWRLPGLARWLRGGFNAVGIGLLALYTGLEIRRFWRGDWLGVPGVSQPELYTYTVALMLLGAALLYQAVARRSISLRRVAMAVIGVTVVKVFLLDASGLTGLTRVISFLGLGLSLAGLAWLNRWAGQVSQTAADAPPPPN